MAAWQNADDFILRIAKQLGTALARIMQLRATNELTAAQHETEAAIATLLGSRADVIDAVDATTAAQLLDDPRAIAWYARLLHERAELLDREHGAAQAELVAALGDRVAVLTREAKRRGAESCRDLDDVLGALP